MDRHTLEQLRSKVGELLRFGSSSCVRQAHEIMIENFQVISDFAFKLTEPKPKPAHTIADNYPAGGISATEPCAFCEDYEKQQGRIEELEKACRFAKTQIKKGAPKKALPILRAALGEEKKDG